MTSLCPMEKNGQMKTLKNPRYSTSRKRDKGRVPNEDDHDS